jgi:intracellular septation protein
MIALLEFSPLLAFGLAYYFGDLYMATGVLMATMALVLAIVWLRTGKLPPVLTGSTALVLIMGTATLILRNARFIQWKPSVFLWTLAAAFLLSSFIGRQPLAQRALQSALGDQQFPRAIWLKINAAWVGFCILAGIANILVAYRLSESAWVKFKIFGLSGAMFVFLMAQMFWLNARAANHKSPPP